MKTYIFKTKLKHDKRTYRIIEMKGNQTLHDLHSAIFNAFDFEEMHLYSFFMSGKSWDNESEYCLPNPEMRSAKSSKNAKVQDLELKPKQKFLYLFDYGDEWEFEIEFLENSKIEKNIKYPKIIKKMEDRQNNIQNNTINL